MDAQVPSEAPVDGGGVRRLSPPRPSSTAASAVMRGNRGRNTLPEIALRRRLWAAGIRGYRLSPRGLPGRPDIAFYRARLVIFVHGCFWHRCPSCKPNVPRSNSAYWREKFANNVARDVRKTRELRELGWEVRVVWECAIHADLDRVVASIRESFARYTLRSLVPS